MKARRTMTFPAATLLALCLSTLQAPAGEVPAERDLGMVQIIKETAVPHPYAQDLRKAVLGTLRAGTLWGRYRDVEDGRRYVGSDACRPCHYDRVEPWARTKMASAIKKLADFRGGLFLNDARCLSCHATGYDPGRDNGGFDEGEGLMAGVQCEACHGPGSLMVEKTDRRFILRTLDADLCGRCHSERYGTGLCFPEYDEWRTSRHRGALETLRRSPAAGVECLECHAADAVAPPSDRKLTLEGASFGVTCEACHNAMVRTFPDLPDNNQLRRPKKELCQWCHSTRRPAPDGLPHAPQAEMFAGTGGAHFAGEDYRNGPMNADIERSCLTCHAVSDRSIARPYQGHAFLPNILACRRCHPDLATFDRKGAQTAVRRLIIELEGRLAAFEGDKSGENYRMALWNLNFVKKDRSFGLHNTDYARKLLTDSLRFLK